MSDLYWLTDERLARLQPYFPKSQGKPRVDNQRVLSGIIFVNRNGLRWRVAPAAYGPHKTLYNCWKRWSEAGIFIRMMECLSGIRAERRTVMTDATYLKAHRTASSLRVKKGDLGRLIGRTKGGMNTKLHAVTDGNGRPISLFMTAGQVSDYTGAAALLDSLPRAKWLLGDRSCDADWFRDALQAKGITPCIPGRKSRTEPIKYYERLYKRRNRIEACLNRCQAVFRSVIALAATVLFWL
ncbi:IS5 family transposase [Asticcacaulis taihuensis]|uniref:IS5 family transposase n=1 Tax=Asticcacaulis taihuensis TaxID=260084 RepID=UPI003F7C19FE